LCGKTGPGGEGTAARSASEAAFLRRNSNFRLSSPFRMAHWWLAEKSGRNSHVSFLSSGFSARRR